MQQALSGWLWGPPCCLTTHFRSFNPHPNPKGPLLEKEGTDIGVVSAIAAPAALEVTFTGSGGHAGALLMPYRNDAGLAAAELALAVEALTLAVGSNDTVGTTGFWEIGPNAVNSVPRHARLGVDIRDIDGERRDMVVDMVKERAEQIADMRRVEHSVRVINQDPPATCSKEVQKAAQEAAKGLGLSVKKMVSRAYHDRCGVGAFQGGLAVGGVWLESRGHNHCSYINPKTSAALVGIWVRGGTPGLPQGML